MNRTLVFDYFYGMQADAYTFYRIPKVLFSDPYFKKLSCEAKVLYGLLLDRMSLSVKNKWFDEQGRVYILFKVEDVCEHMGCCKQTAIKLFAELDSQKGIDRADREEKAGPRKSECYLCEELYAAGRNGRSTGTPRKYAEV